MFASSRFTVNTMGLLSTLYYILSSTIFVSKSISGATEFNHVCGLFEILSAFLVFTVENNRIVDRHEISSEALQHNHAGLSGLFQTQGVSLVITGGIGGPAVQALLDKGLKVIKGASGFCEDILAQYLNGQLQDKNVTCNHHGQHLHQ